jgi:hypothetical protein
MKSDSKFKKTDPTQKPRWTPKDTENLINEQNDRIVSSMNKLKEDLATIPLFRDGKATAQNPIYKDLFKDDFLSLDEAINEKFDVFTKASSNQLMNYPKLYNPAPL